MFGDLLNKGERIMSEDFGQPIDELLFDEPGKLLEIKPSFPYGMVTFYDNNQDKVAEISIDKNGELVVNAYKDFAEAGRESAEIFWEAFGDQFKWIYGEFVKNELQKSN
jgi:hypothetical protein